LERKQILDRLAENFARIVSGHNISSVGAWHLQHFPDMLMSFFHSALEYPCPTIVDRLTRQVSGYERIGQSTPTYMATGERQSAGFPVDSSFATARQSRERASAQRESTEVDRIEAGLTFGKKTNT
jgi:hypothetical protein